MSVRVSRSTHAIEQGQTCPGCGDLCSWRADLCAGCGYELGMRTAKVTPCYGMRPVGDTDREGFGIRGWRAHCEQCGHLGPTRLHVSSVRRDCQNHRCPRA